MSSSSSLKNEAAIDKDRAPDDFAVVGCLQPRTHAADMAESSSR